MGAVPNFLSTPRRLSSFKNRGGYMKPGFICNLFQLLYLTESKMVSGSSFNLTTLFQLSEYIEDNVFSYINSSISQKILHLIDAIIF